MCITLYIYQSRKRNVEFYLQCNADRVHAPKKTQHRDKAAQRQFSSTWFLVRFSFSSRVNGKLNYVVMHWLLWLIRGKHVIWKLILINNFIQIFVHFRAQSNTKNNTARKVFSWNWFLVEHFSALKWWLTVFSTVNADQITIAFVCHSISESW